MSQFRAFDFGADLSALSHQTLHRQRIANHKLRSPFVSVEGKQVMGFCSNDYLGLASEMGGVEQLCDVARQTGFGSQGSQYICGYHPLQQTLERSIAEWVGAERALLFNSGYMANMGVIQALVSAKDHLIMDRLAHASLIDGARLSGAKLWRYRHCDLRALQLQLDRASAPDAQQARQGYDANNTASDMGKALVVTESLFSMDGDFAPLSAIRQISDRYGALLVVDEAHALGVCGPEGAGLLAGTGDRPYGSVLMTGAFGKAIGGMGAFVAGDKVTVDYLEQKCRTLIYTTALPPAICAALSHNIDQVRAPHVGGARRDRLQQLIRYFQTQCQRFNIPVINTDSPIQPILVGGAAETDRLSRALFQRGFWVGSIRPPTVPKQSARLRVTLTSQHTEPMLDQLVKAIKVCAEALSIWPLSERVADSLEKV